MSAPLLTLAYFSPETVLPLTSIIATVAGGAMLLTRGTMRFVIRYLRNLVSRRHRIASTSKPHLHAQEAMISQERHQGE
jgi:hypothetical protein